MRQWSQLNMCEFAKHKKSFPGIDRAKDKRYFLNDKRDYESKTPIIKKPKNESKKLVKSGPGIAI